MAIGNYGELKTAVANWLARGDLTSRIPEFIALAEADMQRNLRNITVVNSLNLVAGTDSVIVLTGTVVGVKGIRYNTASKHYPLTHVDIATLNSLRRIGTGAPVYYAVNAKTAGTMHFDIAPDQAYVMQITTYDGITALSTFADNQSGPLLGRCPDLYLYGALSHAAPFLEHDERQPMWQSLYQKALDDENLFRERQELEGAPLQIQLPVVFG